MRFVESAAKDDDGNVSEASESSRPGSRAGGRPRTPADSKQHGKDKDKGKGKDSKGNKDAESEVQPMGDGNDGKIPNQGPELLLTTESHAGVICSFVDDEGGYLILSHEDVSLSIRSLDVRSRSPHRRV